MTEQTYRQEIAAAKKRYAERQDESAWDAVMISERHGKPLATVCKDIAGDDYRGLYDRSRRRQQAAGQNAKERERALLAQNQQKKRSHTKTVLADPKQATKVLSDNKVMDTLVKNPVTRRQIENALIRTSDDRKPPPPKPLKTVSTGQATMNMMKVFDQLATDLHWLVTHADLPGDIPPMTRSTLGTHTLRLDKKLHEFIDAMQFKPLNGKR